MTLSRWQRLQTRIGERIAPPRFIAFALILVGAGVVLVPPLGLTRGILAGFDLAAFLFLISLVPLLRQGQAARMRARAARNDANRAVLLVFCGVVLFVILVAVGGELRGRSSTVTIALVVTTLILAWLFSNIVYALHYAHLFYSAGEKGDAGGLQFPDTAEPDYWDFLYFSVTLGMTFQTSDVAIAARRMRRVVTGQCLAAFLFNLGVIAFTVNVLGNS
ncbi:hypothetical protein SUS17_3386 [Sphingomonas sp. S17]|jgi:uncharacterized membrane protein|uniref:DUF1345 domain-containing protein n=2 Tax=Sphingomonas paucimobilis TaxID=13689 RepID=A0A411LKY6_SPHPI|nr:MULTISPECIES: DUF1345 domain-containing protein [Sphingomonas]EGI53790.1 hypothetical protein SUS17_3386 [Sphingomonas sp. S17]MBQ1480497.1 DUF1345 domain-containing protein [Sphingomonas sp.]MCM3680398.1 DUF1345 domain-containing protein [Sphingomonas paucimobilis]MDG5970186.1 hypothetical protein [Sphingomonas paucimobilis]NNG56891.1 DUF1345 domain-containing protein [Sphingomonas paucimobilis]